MSSPKGRVVPGIIVGHWDYDLRWACGTGGNKGGLLAIGTVVEWLPVVLELKTRLLDLKSPAPS